MRKTLIAANWKMYKTPEEAVAFVKAFVPLIGNYKHAEIVLCPSPALLPSVVEAARNNPVHVGAQNMHWLDQGAYTGETSPPQLKALGVTHVLIGHSERRQYFNETDESVNLKLKAALKHGLVPIVCVGELLDEREAGQTAEVLERQIYIALSGIDPAAAVAGDRLRARLGHRHRPHGHAGDRRRRAQDHSRADRPLTLARAGRGHTHPLRRIGEGGEHQGAVLPGECRRRAGRRSQP
jgi:hypothetical protein